MASAEIRDKADNPLVFIILVSIGVAAVFKLGQWTGHKVGLPGLSSFFGAK
jgi:hypothetical protein